MSELKTKTLKRFIICYKKKVEGELLKFVKIIPSRSENEAVEKTCDKFDIPIKKIDQLDEKEGYIYCNNVYNPNDEVKEEDET